MSKLLIVEDDETIALGCEYSFKKEGFEVMVAKNCAQAKELLSRNSYDCLTATALKSVNMPNQLVHQRLFF